MQPYNPAINFFSSPDFFWIDQKRSHSSAAGNVFGPFLSFLGIGWSCWVDAIGGRSVAIPKERLFPSACGHSAGYATAVASSFRHKFDFSMGCWPLPNLRASTDLVEQRQSCRCKRYGIDCNESSAALSTVVPGKDNVIWMCRLIIIIYIFQYW